MDFMAEVFGSVTEGVNGMGLDLKNLFIILIGIELLVITGEILIGAIIGSLSSLGDTEAKDYEEYASRRKRNEMFAATYDAENSYHGPAAPKSKHSTLGI